MAIVIGEGRGEQAGSGQILDTDPISSTPGQVVRITGTVPAPTGSATAANQVLEIAALALINTDLTAGAAVTTTSVAQNAASVSLLAANAARLGAAIVNGSTNNASLYVLIKAAAASIAASGYNVIIPPNGYWEMPPTWRYRGEIRGIWSAAGSGFANIAEAV